MTTGQLYWLIVVALVVHGLVLDRAIQRWQRSHTATRRPQHPTIPTVRKIQRTAYDYERVNKW